MKCEIKWGVSFIAILIIAMGISACGSEKDVSNKTPSESQITTEGTTVDNNIGEIGNGDNPFANEEKLETDSEWVEDKLYVLAANEVGEERLENCAADATTVKYLITEPDEMNAWLMQYAILYRMEEEGYTNMEVNFVFYKTQGDAGTKYLQTSYSIETLEQFELSELNNYMELKEYAE